MMSIERSLHNITEYIKPFIPFLNCHMVNYLTDNHWENFIPDPIQNELKNLTNVPKAIEMFWNSDSAKTELFEFKTLLDNNKRLMQDNFNNICINFKDFILELEKLEITLENENIIKIPEFMSPKKQHEVEITSLVVAGLNTYKSKLKNDKKNFVIDVGDGKGYLSSRLALEYNIPVLGIDANNTNTHSAEERVKKLSKAWNGLTKRAENIKNGIAPQNHGKKKYASITNESNVTHHNYKTITKYINCSTNLQELVHEQFPEENLGNLCLSGLHTCGNLASDSLRIFVKNEKVGTLCNIGCCYNHLLEEFIEDSFFVNKRTTEIKQDFGFPLSNFLKNQTFSLGRNARMLASQCVNRTISFNELPSKSLFYRSLLEVLIARKTPERINLIQVGKVKCSNFLEYVQKCSKKHALGLDLHSDELTALEDEFKTQGELLNIFYLIRMTFAQIIEAIILLDKILYLNENRIENVYLVKLFNPIISPRCFGIIGIK